MLTPRIQLLGPDSTFEERARSVASLNWRVGVKDVDTYRTPLRLYGHRLPASFTLYCMSRCDYDLFKAFQFLEEDTARKGGVISFDARAY